ncbi:hypothetical protein BC830DRAFT_938743 [Chytriomyces sp. MP71]|nr:hypothetical protein BC830DRAFT_938743 [Chytriomyces sp. MP71]
MIIGVAIDATIVPPVESLASLALTMRCVEERSVWRAVQAEVRHHLAHGRDIPALLCEPRGCRECALSRAPSACAHVAPSAFPGDIHGDLRPPQITAIHPVPRSQDFLDTLRSDCDTLPPLSPVIVLPISCPGPPPTCPPCQRPLRKSTTGDPVHVRCWRSYFVRL